MRICLVSNEILGAHRNGGIGTSTSHLAILLARHGHAVTLFYVGPDRLDPLSPWAGYYKAANVTVIHFVGSQAAISPEWMRQPVDIYGQLRDACFDVILFQDWKALGHACMVAKRTGLAFSLTTLAVITHSGTQWILEANRIFPGVADRMGLMHMEQQAIELADAVVRPSQYLTDWMTEAGWKLPPATSVLPYFLEGPELLNAAPPSHAQTPRGRVPLRHLVFFGRIEERKGIGIFLAALSSDDLRQFRFKLTFLGRPAG